ncbi:MAG: RsmE family RNA methyltransferase [Bacteroidota bacterium]
MHRAFVYDISPDSETIELAGPELHHALHVIRVNKGQQVEVFNGKGVVFQTEVNEVDKRRCLLKITQKDVIMQDPSRVVHLAIAPTKKMERMEWLVEKATEMGVAKITFLSTKRTERVKLKIERIQKIAASAVKQSGNPFLPVIKGLVDFDAFLHFNFDEAQKYLAHCEDYLIDKPHIFHAHPSPSPAIIMIGPEGDFEENEIAKAMEKGFNTISIGSNIFRTETAGLLAAHAVILKNTF